MSEINEKEGSGLHTEIESCAFVNFLDAVSASIGWKGSRRDAVKIDQAFELTTAKHKSMPEIISKKSVVLDNSFRGSWNPILKDVAVMSKVNPFY